MGKILIEERNDSLMELTKECGEDSSQQSMCWRTDDCSVADIPLSFLTSPPRSRVTFFKMFYF